ncbi:MAG: ribulose-phosphate 3-epimerase [Limisphaerales bacterium]
MIIAPSLLASDFGRLASEVRRVERSGADWLHVDVMDGHFVPNLTFGPAIVAALRKVTRLPLDVHLMCSRPEILLEPFAKAGATTLTIHVELGDRVEALLWRIKALNVKVGLAVNPPTPIAHARPFLKLVDLLLVMTVNPGFGGQSFIEETVPKIQQAHAWRAHRPRGLFIEVDGGITFETVGECARAGADTFVSGTGLFGQASLGAAVRKLRRLAQTAAEGRGSKTTARVPSGGRS